MYLSHRKLVVSAMLAILLLHNVTAWAALVTFTNIVHATNTTILSFTNLANNTRGGTATAYDPVTTGLGYRLVTVECSLTFNAAATAGTTLDIWFLKRPDGTNLEDSDTARLPDVSCPLRASTTTRVSFSEVRLPPVYFSAVALNGSGQQLNSGTVKILPYSQKGS